MGSENSGYYSIAAGVSGVIAQADLSDGSGTHYIFLGRTGEAEIKNGRRWFDLGISGSSPTTNTGNNEKNPNQDLFLNASLIFQY